ncbi:MAG TPA: hypothetical protein PLE28_03055 [bacterium]|nr:hypothetical protein [bacterium]
MKKLFLFFAISLMLTSCFDEATFKLSNGQMVTIDRKSLEFNVGQKVWLVRDFGINKSDWEILSDFQIKQIGFQPTEDTIFTFKSLSTTYQRRVALGTLVKKK